MDLNEKNKEIHNICANDIIFKIIAQHYYDLIVNFTTTPTIMIIVLLLTHNLFMDVSFALKINDETR